MREVSCRCVDVFEHVARKHGVNFEELVSDLGVPVEELRDHGSWIDWELYVELVERVAERVGKAAAIEGGRDAVHLETTAALRRIVSVVVGTDQVYLFGFRWMMPMLIRNMRVNVQRLSADTLHVDVALPPHARGSRLWFQHLGAALEAAPVMIGEPPARVESQVDTHRSSYRVTLPRGGKAPWLRRLRGLGTGGARRAIEEQIEEMRALDEERRHVEEVLRERERTLANLIANISGMVYRCRGEHLRFDFVAGRTGELTGYAAGELTDGGRSLLDLVHPDDRERVRRARLETHSERAGALEYRMLTTSGGVRWVLDTARPSPARRGQIEVEGFITDITLRRRLEDDLHHARRLEGLGRLAGGVAHDFNNLLAAIVAYAELARRGIPSDSRPAEQVEQILRAAERAAALTRQLLAFARKQPVKPGVVDVNGLIGNMEDLLRRSLGGQITLEIELTSGAWPVEIDRGQLEQVLLNLALNARDAMPSGGTLRIVTHNQTLDVASNGPDGMTAGDYLVLEIHDTGTGMSEDVQRHAFEPFFTTKAVGEGTGLGLASAHGTVRQAGGHITLQSRPGRGTSFHVYLPRAQRRPATTQEAESRMSRPPASTGKTVLVVDDEPLVRDSVVALLEARGYRVLPAATASEAEAHFAVEQGSVELLITDVRMPACSGIELARRLRDREPGLPVLYISGFNDAAADWGDSGAGRSRSLDKPFTGQQLDDAVRSLLDLTVTSAGQ